MLSLICLGLFIPLIGFISLIAFGNSIHRRWIGVIACSTIFISFLCFLAALVNQLNTQHQHDAFTLFNWIPIQGISTDFSLYVDHLSLLMTLIITGVGFLIHVYSIGYMDHEEDLVRYFACLNFFVFAMLLLVLAGNLAVLFIGWEGVGLASYLLIGFWYTRPAAAQAATKAFVMNRIGDLGFLLALLLTFYLFGTSDLQEISQSAHQKFAIGAPIITLLTLLYFVAATGKSAQLPLYSWLPDAMEGPTPVSALIHAATMVTAGVYLVVRMHPVFMLAPFTLQTIGVVGAITSLFAALCAISQTNLKKVLAYSTVSQLGLMFIACGAGAFYSAMFHLTTHAFVKALLFLSAGNVIHMLHDTTSMEKMGGLSKIFTKTHGLFLVGVLALSGIPPFAAFFSKDLILEQEYLSGHHFLFYIGFAASILTAFYLVRAYCLTFTGKTRMEESEWKTTKEAPKVMLVPVFILALLSIGAGAFLGFKYCQHPLLEGFLSELGLNPVEQELHSGFTMTIETWWTLGGVLAAVALAVWMYTRRLNRLGSPIALFKNAFYLNEIYDAIFVSPLQVISGWIANIAEPKIFNGLINKTTETVQKIAHEMQKFQSGQIRSYFAWMILGSVFLLLYLVL